MPGYRVEANVIVDADCIGGPAMNTAWKLDQFMGVEIPLGLSTARGFNPFVWNYRSDCVAEGQIESLADYPVNPDWPWYPNGDTDVPAPGSEPAPPSGASGTGYPDGDALLAASLDHALTDGNPITVVVNCPFTPLQTALAERPERANAIERVIWMGGAVDLIPGNLDPKTLPPTVANPYAEWNAFWDPSAVDWIFRNTTFPIIMFPLNVTNAAKISKEFLAALKVQGAEHRYSKMAFASSTLVADETFYSMWDMTSVCYITQPELYQAPRSMRLEIVTQGYYQGTILENAGGREVQVVMDFADLQGFYDYVLAQLRR
jgi:purine nucleosidase